MKVAGSKPAAGFRRVHEVTAAYHLAMVDAWVRLSLDAVVPAIGSIKQAFESAFNAGVSCQKPLASGFGLRILCPSAG